MPHIRMIITMVCLLLSAVAFAADEDIYKWTDAKKQVHYGSNPPPDAHAVLITPNGQPSEKAKADAQAINKSIEQATTSKGAAVVSSVNAADPKAKQEACDSAKAEYEKIANASRISTQNDQGGYEKADEEKRKSMVQERQAAADKACAP